jgi:hypothetical protein
MYKLCLGPHSRFYGRHHINIPQKIKSIFLRVNDYDVIMLPRHTIFTYLTILRLKTGTVVAQAV